MDPKLLYQFHYICELGSLSAAAKWLNICQPTLTRNLQTLEMTVGQSLVIRSRFGVSPTEIGIILSEQGAQIVREVQRAEEVINTAKNQSLPMMRIGAGPVIAATFLNEFCAEELSRSQAIPFSTSVRNSRDLINDLIYNRLDIAIMATPPDSRVSGLGCQFLSNENIALFAGSKSPLGRLGRLPSKGELEAARWVTMDVALGPVTTFNSLIANLGIEPMRPVAQFGLDVTSIIHCLKTSDVLAFLPEQASQKMMHPDDGITKLDLNLGQAKRVISIWYRSNLEVDPILWSCYQRCLSFFQKALDTDEAPRS